MRKILALILTLVLFACGILSVQAAHRAYHSLWLDIYLAFFIVLPLVLSAWGLAAGREGVKNFFQILALVGMGLVIATVIYKYLMPNWLVACLVSIVIPGIFVMMRQWRMTKAQAALAQASTDLQSGRPQQALQQAQFARAIFLQRGNRAGQAAADMYLAVGYRESHEPLRAARYMNSALALYQALGQQEQITQAQTFLLELRQSGIDTEASAVSVQSLQEEMPRLDIGFIFNGLIAVACGVALVWLWQPKGFPVSPASLAVLGGFFLVLIYGNYALAAGASQRDPGDRKHRGPFLAFHLGLAGLILGLIAVALDREMLHPADFPDAIAPTLGRMAEWITSWPAWLTPVLVGVGALLMIVALVAASGRSPFVLLRNLFRADMRSQALDLARGHMDAAEWTQAITQLTRIDLTTEKNPERRKEVLFCLAFAHHKVGHPAEARQYARELLEVDPQHRAGLYLSGYLALQDNHLDAAEAAWRALYRVAPRFRPAGAAAGDAGADYYLCLTLYRKAMSLIDKDLEQGAQLLAEVSGIGALDTKVSEALVRVHLYRCVPMLRRDDWQAAGSEVALARDKVFALTKPDEMVDQGSRAEEVVKLTGLWYTASGLVALGQERYPDALDAFDAAVTETKDIACRGNLFDGGSGSFFEQLMRSLARAKADEEGLDPLFSRDLQFLAAVAQLRSLQEETAASVTDEWKTALAQAESHLEASLSVVPTFVEARAMLGLLYFHTGADKAKREKGIELLQSVRERVSSRFVSQTVADWEADKKRSADARKAYFDLLQQYLLTANVPKMRRQELRAKVLDNMKASGEYDAFVGRGSLEIETEREREPTVQEYLQRAALLREKLDQLKQLQRSGELPSEVARLVADLNTSSESLQKQVKGIMEIEQQLLLAAQGLL